MKYDGRCPVVSAELDTSCYATYTWSVNCCLGKALKSAPPLSHGEPFVTKKEIVKTISEEIGLTQLKTKEIVQKTFDAIVETLVEEKRIELRNFGVFEVKKRAARKARNPRTGDKVYVAEKYVVTFKPGKEMEARVRELEGQAAEAAADGRSTDDGIESLPAVAEPMSETLTTQPIYGGNSEAAT